MKKHKNIWPCVRSDVLIAKKEKNICTHVVHEKEKTN